MNRKTDFLTQEAKAYEMVNKFLNKHITAHKQQKEVQAAIDKKKADLKAKEQAQREKAAKEKADKEAFENADDGAQVKELTKEEIELMEREEALKKDNPGAAAADADAGDKDEEEKKDGDGEDAGKDEKPKGAKPNAGNGGETDKYQWEQTIDELTVNINIPKGTTAKMLDVKISQTHLVLGIKGQDRIIDGEWFKEIRADDALWSIEKLKDGSRYIQINLTKKVGMSWWDGVIKGDPVIDTQGVNPENSKLSDLDGETRSTVEKMMFDQQQKQRGLPTSDEMEKKNKLQAFMDAHPEMDFSKAKFN